MKSIEGSIFLVLALGIGAYLLVTYASSKVTAALGSLPSISDVLPDMEFIPSGSPASAWTQMLTTGSSSSSATIVNGVPDYGATSGNQITPLGSAIFASSWFSGS